MNYNKSLAIFVIYFNLISTEIVNNSTIFKGHFKELCKKQKCIQKCCLQNEFMYTNELAQKFCLKTVSVRKVDFSEVNLYYDNLTKSERSVKDVFVIVPGAMLNQTFNTTSYDYSTEGIDHLHYLREDGILIEEDPNKFVRWYELSVDKFCVDYRLNDDKTIDKASFYTVMTSSSLAEPSHNVTVYIAGLLISCFFLTLALVVYMLLPGAKTLSEWIQVAYVGSTLGAFLLMAAILENPPYKPETCMGLSYTAYFFFLASFSWMTVMSFDLWRVHRRLNHHRGSKRSADQRFRRYSIFAWGVPASLTIFLIAANHVDLRHMAWFIKPYIPEFGCFLAGYQKMLYFYVPIMVLILTNWVFFLLTSCNLWSQYQLSATLGKQKNSGEHRTLKNRLLAFLKLSILTGLSWVLEVASSFNPNLEFWYITDFYNMLIGFSIFLIFYCNRKTWNGLKKRFKTLDERRTSSDTNVVES